MQESNKRMKEAKQERQELNWQLAYSRERDGACSD